MKGVFQDLIGKTITGVQVREDVNFHSTQVFLAFDDDTYFELYSDGRMNGIRQIYPGDMDTIRDLPAGNSEILVDVEHTDHGL